MGCGNGCDQRTDSEVRARRYLYQMRPYTEEPGAEQFARPVLDWRRRGRPLRRPYGKMRKLGIPSAADKVVQSAIKLVLEPIYECVFRDCSHGFRPERSCQTALRAYMRSGTPTWTIEGDLKSYFDHAS